MIGALLKRLFQSRSSRLQHAARAAYAAGDLVEAFRMEFNLPAERPADTAAALVKLLFEEPLQRWQHRMGEIERLGWAFSRNGGYAQWGEGLIRVLEACRPADLAPGHDEHYAEAVLRFVDFSKNAPATWMDTVFARVLWPWMRQALDLGRHGLALMLENRAYAYVVARESGEHFHKTFAVWNDAMRHAGHREAASLPPLSLPPTTGLPGVGFYLHSGSVLGHTQILLEFLEAHALLERPLIRPQVFVRAGTQAELRTRLAAIGVPCHEIDRALGTVPEADLRALLWVREQVAAQTLSAIVWVSVALHMAFAFSLRIAPVQIWWAMKYHSLKLPEIDGYLTNQSAGTMKMVKGELWRSAPLASSDWYRPQLAPQARALRASYSDHDLLFGCIGREEKINSPPFLEAVARILKARPNAGFLWTGRERSAAVQSTLERLGVAQRCHFIGWVDTKLYAQVLDIFLDSFPFPCGFTLYEAMAAGKAVVVYASAEAAETGFYGLLQPLLAGAGTQAEVDGVKRLFADGRLFYCAADPERYVEYALKLAHDAAARGKAGYANQAFVQEYLSDRGRMARAVGVHLHELIETKRPG